MVTSTQDLISEVIASLHSFTGDLEQTSTLYQNLTSGDLSFTYTDSGTNTLDLDRGFVEIDDELLMVAVVDQNSNVASIPVWGRGLQGSTAVAHSAGARITQAPRFPRARVLSVINEVISSLDTYLFAVKKDESLTGSPVVNTYALPADCSQVLMVTQQRIGPTGEWRKLTNWRADLLADSSFSTGKTITFGRGVTIEPGKTIKITYAGPLNQITTGGNLVDSGLSESCRDVLALGAQARLLLTVDASRLQQHTIEQQQRSQLVPPGSGSGAAMRLQQLFQQRVQDEKLRLERLYPAPLTMSR